MPRYEYRCRACGDTFELSRPMAAARDAATCPHGHDDTVRLLSTVALTGRAGASTGPGPAPMRPAGGGCCGGACGC
jgi:putative FmdB family regulatory protein